MQSHVFELNMKKQKGQTMNNNILPDSQNTISLLLIYLCVNKMVSCYENMMQKLNLLNLLCGKFIKHKSYYGLLDNSLCINF